MSEKSDDDRKNRKTGAVTRRRALKGGGALAALGIVGGGGVALMSNPVSAAVTDANEFVANGAQITAEDGSVSGLGFGDRDTIADDELVLQYEGFEQDDPVPVDFTLEVRGADSPNNSISGETTEAFSTGGGKATFETIATETGVTFSPVTDGGGLAGEVSFGWNEAFTTATEDGSELIAVTNDSDIGSDGNNGSTGHTALSNSDFSSTTDDGTRVRELVVRVSAEIDATSTNAIPDSATTLSDSDTARVLIVVNNRQAALVGDVADGIGGQGSMQLNSTNVINSSENETAIDDSGNPLP
jgi:hypothetical protein